MSEICTEEWRDVVDYEGHYQVSNFGRVKSLARIVKTPRFYNGIIVKEKILHPKTVADGYAGVSLYKPGCKMKTGRIHRLLVQVFIPNPENKPQVNHIDFNRKNNHISNLEWCTNKENCDHSVDRVMPNSMKQINRVNALGLCNKPVIMMDKKGNYIKEFPSVSAASIEVIGRVTSVINAHIADTQNIRKSAYGYTWAFKH